MDSDGEAVPRLAPVKKKAGKKSAGKDERHVSTKKRQRSSSVSKSDGVSSDDPRERLAAFHARMFDAKHDEMTHSFASPANPDDAVLLAKWKPGNDSKAAKKRKFASNGRAAADDDDEMPRIAVKSTAKRTTRSSKDKSSQDDAKAPASVVAKPVKTAVPGIVVQAARAAVQSPALKRKATHSMDSSMTRVAAHIAHKDPQRPSAAAAVRATKASTPQKRSGVALGATAAVDPIDGASHTATGVVTQAELSKLSDELSAEDPLERALRTAKELAAKTRKAAKTKAKTTAKTKKTKVTKQQRQRVLSSDSHSELDDVPSAATAPLVVAVVEPSDVPTNEQADDAVAVAATALPASSARAAKVQRSALNTSASNAVQAVATNPKKQTSKKQQKIAKRRAMSIDLTAGMAALPEREPSVHAATAPVAATVAVTTEPATPERASIGEQTTSSEAPVDAAPTDLDAASKSTPTPVSEPDVMSDSEQTPVPVPTPVQTTVLVGKSDVASDSEADTPAHRQLTRQSKQQQKEKEKEEFETVSAPHEVATTDEVPASTAAIALTQSPVPASTQKTERVKRTRAAKESAAAPSEVVAAAAKQSTKQPTKRRRAEKLLMERHAVAQAVAAAAAAGAQSDRDDDRQSESDADDVVAMGDTLEDADNDADADDGDGDVSDAATAETTGSADAQQIFSTLIDEAARQQWELLEVGRLVKLFAGQWGHKKKKTARFLRRCCPELVNVEFLEGLGMALKPVQLVKIFERGSGTAAVLMNKLASAIENGNVSVRDAAVVDAVTTRAQHLPTNHDVLAFLMPLLESLSTVRDAGALLQAVSAHWHVERAATLVQQVLLTPVFHDLEGSPDELLDELPHLRGKLDFPSRLDEADADEHGNLIGLIASEGSDLGEDSSASDVDAAEDALSDVGSDDDDEDDEHGGGSDVDDEIDGDEGETDSEDERVVRRPKRRSRFVLDEADEASEDEDEDENDDGSESDDAKRSDAADLVTEDSSSESESESESWRSKPKRAASAKR